MSNYVMTRYSYDKAKQYGLTVKLSKNPLKKLDVYKGNIFLASIGDSRFKTIQLLYRIRQGLC